jgi:hypothetical protein
MNRSKTRKLKDTQTKIYISQPMKIEGHQTRYSKELEPIEAQCQNAVKSEQEGRVLEV